MLSMLRCFRQLVTTHGPERLASCIATQEWRRQPLTALVMEAPGPPDPKGSAHDSSLKAYYKLLRYNANMRNLWLGELVNNAGGWFNYVATLALVDRLSQGSSIAISMVLIVRFLPFAFFFPVAGVVADRYRRELVLIVTCLLDAAVVALLALAQWLPYIWPLYALLFLQFTCSAFYDPARRSLTPLIVPPSQLHLAATIDSTTWSLMAAVGSALGGLVSSQMGPTTCFLLDSLSYLVAAWFAWQLLGKVPTTPAQDAGAGVVATTPAKLGPSMDKTVGVELTIQRGSESPLSGSPRKRALQPTQEMRLSADTGFRERGALGGLLQEPPALSEVAAGASEAASGGFLAIALHRFKDELADIRAGFSYIGHSSNRGVAMLTLLKASGAMVWAAADIMNVKYAVLPSMQALGDEQVTLGWIFAAVGIGCLIGPIGANWMTEPECGPLNPTLEVATIVKPPQLMRTICLSFAFLWLSFGGMAVSGHIWGILLCTALRSAGAAIVWVYSTLLLQLVVPNALLGRMMALELAFNTICESAGGLWAGVAMDRAGLSVRQLALVMAGVGLVVCALWTAYTLLGVHSARTPGSKYQAVASDDAEAPAAVLQSSEE